jgi:hypothetical protein
MFGAAALDHKRASPCGLGQMLLGCYPPGARRLETRIPRLGQAGAFWPTATELCDGSRADRTTGRPERRKGNSPRWAAKAEIHGVS